MLWIRNLHLRSKLILLSAVTVGLALSLACAGFLLNDLRLLRDSKIRQLTMQAELLSYNSSVVVAMGQHDQADELLRSLRSQPTIDAAGLYDAAGEQIAIYANSVDVLAPLRIPEKEGIFTTSRGDLEIYQPILEQATRVGTVYLRTSLHDIWNQMSSYSKVSLLVMAVSLAIATLFGTMMQDSVSKPILQLAETACKITSSDDYSIRVHSDARDELGVLYSSFNRMIEQVESSRRELELARKDLENRVEDRTFLLQEEIEHRKRVQTELVLAKERAEAASHAKSCFLANMSHEIRTPLNAILGFADLLRRGADRNDDLERRDFLETIHQSGEHLLTLINDILDLSKIEAGQTEYEHLRFSPHDIIAEVMSVMRVRAQEKGLTLEYDWQGSIPESINSDPARFRQLLLNLVGNAIKFTEHGGVKAVARLSAERNELTVDIIDTGIGIPANVCDAIFSPFTQADSSVTRRFGGTGLGLSISRHIAEGLGGHISVQSEVGRGSIFSVTIATGPLSGIPVLERPISDIISNLPSVQASESLRLDGCSILVVDDGETNRKLIRLVLKRAGAEVCTADNGAEAIAVAQDCEFDLILMDMQMPLMDGYTASRCLRDNGYTKPIVALTAHAMRGDAERCHAAGCSGYLTKPINPDKLIEKICKNLAGSDPSGVSFREAIPEVGDKSLMVSSLPMDDPDYADIVCEFTDRFTVKLAEMQMARAADDMQNLSQLAHWLAGAGGTAGFPFLTEAARELEEAIEQNLTQEIDDQLSRLHGLLVRITDATISQPELV